VFLGAAEISETTGGQSEIDSLLSFCDSLSNKNKLEVRINADSADEVKDAFGIKKVGLCRTEHMIFDHIKNLQNALLGKSNKQNLETIKKVYIQKLREIHKYADVVCVRLLDAPMSEFLPNRFDEVNPMLGNRGVRFGITYPEFYKMQIEAIFIAAIEAKKVEILIPLVSTYKELEIVANIIHLVAKDIYAKYATKINYKIGTMIETPRAALIAGQLAQICDFFSFGTNDLTQMTYGISRDDGSQFLKHYQNERITLFDPFTSIDEEGVGQLMKIAIQEGKKANPHLEIGVCGEHAHDTKSLNFLSSLNIDYISCSAKNVPKVKINIALIKS
jgi:pyruvate,orthophosphate dikinase